MCTPYVEKEDCYSQIFGQTDIKTPRKRHNCVRYVTGMGRKIKKIVQPFV